MPTTKKTGGRILGRIVPYVARYSWLAAGALACIVLMDAAGVLGPWLVKRAIDVNVAQKDLAGLAWTVFLLGLSILGGWVCSILSGYGVQYLGQRFLLFGSLTQHPFPCRMAAYLNVRAERHLRCEAIDGIQHCRHP